MKCFVMFALVMYSLTSGAQTWEEWFEQKETQKKYLRQQIAALTVFLDYAKKRVPACSRWASIYRCRKKWRLPASL